MVEIHVEHSKVRLMETMLLPTNSFFKGGARYFEPGSLGSSDEFYKVEIAQDNAYSRPVHEVSFYLFLFFSPKTANKAFLQGKFI